MPTVSHDQSVVVGYNHKQSSSLSSDTIRQLLSSLSQSENVSTISHDHSVVISRISHNRSVIVFLKSVIIGQSLFLPSVIFGQAFVSTISHNQSVTVISNHNKSVTSSSAAVRWAEDHIALSYTIQTTNKGSHNNNNNSSNSYNFGKITATKEHNFPAGVLNPSPHDVL